MKLLLLIPNIILMIISGYNLLSNDTWKNEPNFLTFTILHVFVFAMCLVFAALIVKSAFSIRYTEIAEIDNQADEDIYSPAMPNY